ncbi:hypothetical protein MVES_002090 [Malassezia vespertilionis]|uniref:RRM domain-containing protein n=1 Tax=Malassezia vespertilionis TaxID=2020962 RepID=A0A2N1JBV3_9BASI|nr:hypothetical protein MVES_002090 [Malassezia vespertilionis]
MTKRKPRFRVVVEPLNSFVTPEDITQLFQPLDIRSVTMTQRETRNSATVALNNARDVDMACLRDATFFGGHKLTDHPYQHASPSPPKSDADSEQEDAPELKNLYVLNLPLHVTTVQLEQLFEEFGPVQHCVILSMLDGEARRRGFVDMDTAQHAHQALSCLQGKVWFGYPLEISYARVQRSTGPFAEQNTSRTIFIKGLLPAATIDADDVKVLVSPYATVERVEYPPMPSDTATFQVTVTLRSPEDARAVYTALHNTNLHGQQLEVVPSL